MAWYDRLLSASFRGIGFYVDSSERSVGRNTVVDELNPINKKEEHMPYVSDNGKGLDQFVIEGYVINNKGNKFDYFKARDDLKLALETFGPGQLKHPYWGVLNVVLVGQAKIAETNGEGGIAKFSMTFAKFDNRTTPIRSKSSADHIDNNSQIVADKINSSLTNLYQTGSLFKNVSANAFKNILKDINQNINSIRGIASQVISETNALIASYIAQVDSIIDTPSALYSMVTGVFDSIVSLCETAVESVQGSINGLVQMATGESLIKSMTKSMEFDTDTLGFIPDDQTKNVVLIDSIMKIQMASTAMIVAIETNFESQQEMEEFVTILQDATDTLLDAMGEIEDTDELFAALQDMRGVFVEGVYARITDLKKEKDYNTLDDVMSTLELAYDLYEDLDREEEIITRNRFLIRHPGFVPEGSTVSVLDE